MQSDIHEFTKYFGIVVRRKNLFILLSLIIMSVIVWGSYLLPKKYKAQSMVFIERNVIKDLVGDITVTPSMDYRIRVLRYTMLSRDHILKVLEDLDLDMKAQNPVQLEEMIRRYQEKTDISVRGNDLFTVSMTGTDPKIVTDYINTIVSRYLEDVLEAKRAESYGADRFIGEQLALFKQKLDKAEEEIIKFRQTEGIYVAFDDATIVRELEELSREVESLKLQRNELTSVVNAMQNQLKVIQPYTAASLKRYESESVSALEKSVDRLLVRYTENHPEVIKLRAMIDDLKRNKSAGSVDGSAVATTESDELVPNPVYQEIETNYLDVKSKLEAVNARLKQLVARAAQKEKELRVIPEQRKILSGLVRERDAQKSIYNKLLERQGLSEVSKQMEVEDKATTFRVVDPAVIPTKPFSPNMKKIIVLGIFFGFFGGMAGVILREQLDSSVKNVDALKALKITLLAVVPQVANDDENTRQKKKDRMIYAISGAYFLLICTVLLFEVMNLNYVDSVMARLQVRELIDTISVFKKGVF